MAGAAALAGCRDGAAGTATPAAPADSQIATDLVGVRFAFFEDEQGPKHWTVEEGEVRELQVVDGSTTDDGRRHRARVRAVLVATNRTIRGDLDVYYARDGSRWVFDEAARAGGNWSVEELAAVVYEAHSAAPGDTTVDSRDVWLEPMFRYHEGDYSAPLDAFSESIRSLEEADFASDSARRAALAGLEGRVAGRYLDPSWTVFLLAPGSAPAPVRIAKRDASLSGCTYVVGRVRAETPQLAAGSVLATSSSTMGGATFAGREPAPDEADRLAVLARDRLAVLGAPPDGLRRLRSGRVLAADLDGDGRDELVGAFGVAGRAGVMERALIVAGRPAPAAYGLVAERTSAADDGWGGLDMVGALDVDGDGDLEIVARETGDDVYRFVVLSRRPDGAWEEVFTGGGGGCRSE